MPTIQSYNKRLTMMRSERSDFIPLYRELSDYHLSHRGRFLTSDRNKGHKRNTKQINNTSRLASRTLSAGMMAGITSPARPWFRLGSGDKQLDERVSVKRWLHRVMTIMYKVYSASNTYNALHQLYSELGVFGTAAMGVYEDFENVIWCAPYTVGSYMLGLDGKNNVDTMYREYEKTVGQVVKMFGIENVSSHVKKQFDDGNTEAWVKVVHIVEPNDDRDNQSPMAKDMPIRSAYYEDASGKKRTEEKDSFLRQSGFVEFPILAPRWDVTGEDVYATDCPGITALGDVKSLQLAERRKYQAIDKIANPPLQGPSDMKQAMKGKAPQNGEVVWHSEKSAGLTPVYGNYQPNINVIKEEILDTEQRVKRAYYEDLFLMLAQSDRRQITAREVAEKHEEKLLMLGPVLERLHNELLDPLIDRTFNILQRNGVLPPPPPEMQNQELTVEYVSVLAQAQRLVNTGALDRIVEFTGAVSGVWPDARHKINSQQLVDDYSEALGVNPAIINSDDESSAAAAAEAQAAQAAQAMASAPGTAQAAKTASETPVGDSNMLDRAMNSAGLG